jgi:hypothetical protein
MNQSARREHGETFDTAYWLTELSCDGKQLRPDVDPEWLAIIRHYAKNSRPRKIAELDGFRGEVSLRSAVERAALALDCNGKRFKHQHRVRRDAMLAAEAMLLQIVPELELCRSFDQLLEVIEGVLRGIGGIGEMYVYDAALRIGAKLNLLPRRIHLHRGTRAGAEQLGLRTDVPALNPEELPAALRALPPYEVEDILCIYKDRFRATRGTDSAV